MRDPGDIIEELDEEYYGNWFRIVGPNFDGTEPEILVGKMGVDSGPNSVIWAERNARVRMMAESIAEFVRQHQADW